MPTALLRKPTRTRKGARKARPAHRTKVTTLTLSDAEIARINGAQESLVTQS